MASRSSSPAPPRTDAVAVAVERRPPASRLSELGVRSWPKWGGGPGRIALSYAARQTCYLVRGKVTAAVEGSPSPEKGHVEFGAGDLVVFSRGTRCTWHIAVAVDMHYAFDPS
ncbi:hypothetical protein ABZP36_011677 [Zizania latifolia]